MGDGQKEKFQLPEGNVYIELHLHLDGAVTVEIAERLAQIQEIELPAKNRAELKQMLTVSQNCTSLNEFLECFSLPLSLMQTKAGISEAVYLVQENLKRQHVIYGEIRFAPQLHRDKGLTQEEAIQAALEGLGRSNLPCNLILCCMRGEDTEEANRETFWLAEKYLVKNGGVVAVDLAGAEALYPTSDYTELFLWASNHNIPFTVHAGEADGAQSVKCAVRMGARRIGHGVRIYEDEKLVDEIKEKGIVLEMCPTSNRQTKAVENMGKYPLKKYLKQGIRVTLNTDDMGICGTTLPEEFAYAKEMLGVTKGEERQMLLNAAEAAFTDEAARGWLCSVIAERYQLDAD